MSSTLFGMKNNASSNSYARVSFEDDEFEMDDIHMDRNNSFYENEGTPTFTIDDNDDGDGRDDNDVHDESFGIQNDDHGYDHASDIEKGDCKSQPTSELSLEKRSIQENNTPPTNYICPLTLHIMNEPMNDGCGHCFDRLAITDWLEYHEICPISRKPVHFSELKPAKALETRIKKWKSQHPEYTTSRDEDEESTAASNSDWEGHSQIELMLLPQERTVLQIIKHRANDRRRQRDFSKCIWSILVSAVLLLFVATCIAFKMYGLELHGPI